MRCHRNPLCSVRVLGLMALIGGGAAVSAWADPPGSSARSAITTPDHGAAPVKTKNLAVTPIEAEAGVLMQAKLSSSKKLLEGLLRRDFDSIARAAREMKRISQATEWPRPRDEVYEHFSAEFQRQCNQLESQANELNHEGIKFTYLHMTTTCINCHEYIRDSRRMAELNDPSNVRPIPSQWPQSQLR